MIKAVESHLAELESKGYSKSRLTHVRRTIELLTFYLKKAHQIGDWRAVNEKHRWFAVFARTRRQTRKGEPVSSGTLRQWLSCVRRFFAWMNESGRLAHNPAERLKLPRKSRSLPRVLSESEIAQPDRERQTPTPPWA